VNGTIDVLCKNNEGQGVLVVDYKTDALAAEDDLQQAAEHHAPQMAAYAVAASRMGGGFPVTVNLVFLDREGAEVSRRYSEADIAAAERELMELIDAMGDGLFRPLDGVDRGFCPGCVGFKGDDKLCSTAAKA
jgi:hypothetical protein